MIAARATPSAGAGSLWGLSLLVSLMVNGGLFFGIAWLSLSQRPVSLGSPPPPPPERVDLVALVMPADEALAPVEPKPKPPTSEPDSATPSAAPSLPPVRSLPFAKTTEDQASTEAPVTAAFIGERNTIATSERTPDATGPDLPSQAGMKESAAVVETVEGKPAEPAPDRSVAAPSIPAVPAMPQEPVAEPSVAAKSTDLLEGPLSVPVPAPPPEPEKPSLVPAEPPKPEPVPEVKPPVPAEPEAQAAKKTELAGSISRTGKSAVNVIDTPLGRYRAVVSDAVQTGWLQNCERYQKYITAGYMTVKFQVEPDGKVKSVEVVEAVDCTDVQKGFTNQAIRAAKFPKIPNDLKKTLGKEPLEVTIIFYF
ncbi:hypothetical protein [Luteolibacter sp. LG18]|uniref:energy transducer TonB family protein n=1 Tax=Luteolibacter sp. LG18 TaxID=2819286 RepID=UPI002B30AE90|nr:hypothetical protein llg_01170 [Luteolibacter sp. LG18]